MTSDMLYSIKQHRTRKQVLDAAYVLIRVLYPDQISKFDEFPLLSLYNNDVSAFLKTVISDYACSKYSKNAPEFRIVRDGYSHLCKFGTVGPLGQKPKKIVEIEGVESGRIFISEKAFQPYTCSQVQRVWAVIDPDFKESMQPVHHKNCFLEDNMHDWHIKKVKGKDVGISYYGILLRKSGKLLLEFSED